MGSLALSTACCQPAAWQLPWPAQGLMATLHAGPFPHAAFQLVLGGCSPMGSSFLCSNKRLGCVCCLVAPWCRLSHISSDVILPLGILTDHHLACCQSSVNPNQQACIHRRLCALFLRLKTIYGADTVCMQGYTAACNCTTRALPTEAETRLSNERSCSQAQAAHSAPEPPRTGPGLSAQRNRPRQPR